MFKQMIKKSIHKSQHCNRNWDLSKDIPQEDIDLIVESATQCPAKQNLNFYKTHVITNRDKIKKIHSHTQGFELNGKFETNPQTLANLLLVFTKDHPKARRTKEEDKHGSKTVSFHDDRLQAKGIAVGYVNLVSTMLGYETGCCKCFNVIEVAKELNGEEPVLMMGIGYPDTNRSRLEHHNDPSIKFPSFKNKRQVVIHA